MKRITMITTLIPILFLLFVGSVNAEKIYTSDSYFTAGSTVVIHYYNNDFDFTLPVGKIYMYYELYDAKGNKVYKWVKTPMYYEYSVTHQYAEDYFEFKIPNMMGFVIFDDRPEGEWTLKASVHDATGDIDYSSIINYKFNVYRGNIIDNLFAPIYVYKGYKVFGIEVAHMQFKLFPLGWIITFILAIFLFVLLIRYIRFALKQGKIIISRSSARIKKEWRTKG